MADAEQVSSTTPNEVEENEMKVWSESGFSEATGSQELVQIQDENVGWFGGEQDVRDVKEEQEAHAGKVSYRQEKKEKETDTSENKAETECLEKFVDLISKPVECESPEEPDSTQIEDEITAGEEAEAEVFKRVDLKEAEEVAVTAAFTEPVQAFPQDIQNQDAVVSSATELQAPFRSEQIQEQLMTTTETRQETFFTSEDFAISSSVKEEEAFSAPVEPQKARSSVVEEKEEPERRTVLEESFRTDSESTPAASASPSAREWSCAFIPYNYVNSIEPNDILYYYIYF